MGIIDEALGPEKNKRSILDEALFPSAIELGLAGAAGIGERYARAEATPGYLPEIPGPEPKKVLPPEEKVLIPPEGMDPEEKRLAEGFLLAELNDPYNRGREEEIIGNRVKHGWTDPRGEPERLLREQAIQAFPWKKPKAFPELGTGGVEEAVTEPFQPGKGELPKPAEELLDLAGYTLSGTARGAAEATLFPIRALGQIGTAGAERVGEEPVIYPGQPPMGGKPDVEGYKKSSEIINKGIDKIKDMMIPPIGGEKSRWMEEATFLPIKPVMDLSEAAKQKTMELTGDPLYAEGAGLAVLLGAFKAARGGLKGYTGRFKPEREAPPMRALPPGREQKALEPEVLPPGEPIPIGPVEPKALPPKEPGIPPPVEPKEPKPLPPKEPEIPGVSERELPRLDIAEAALKKAQERFDRIVEEYNAADKAGKRDLVDDWKRAQKSVLDIEDRIRELKKGIPPAEEPKAPEVIPEKAEAGWALPPVGEFLSTVKKNQETFRQSLNVTKPGVKALYDAARGYHREMVLRAVEGKTEIPWKVANDYFRWTKEDGWEYHNTGGIWMTVSKENARFLSESYPEISGKPAEPAKPEAPTSIPQRAKEYWDQGMSKEDIYNRLIDEGASETAAKFAIKKLKAKAPEKKKAEPWPKEVQRFDSKDVDLDFDKPQGLYTTPGDVESPHKEAGTTGYNLEINPEAKTIDIEEFPARDVVMRKGAVNAGAGVHAARYFLGEDTFRKMKEYSMASLQGYGKRKWPKLDWTKHTDKQEVMEAIGANLARDKGYDAFRSIDRKDPSFTEIVLLTRNAIRGEKIPKPEGEAPPQTPVSETIQEAVDASDYGQLTKPEMKKYLLDNIDQAIKDQKMGVSKGETITIHIPQDGDFTVMNNPEALKRYRDAVQKIFPTKSETGKLKPAGKVAAVSKGEKRPRPTIGAVHQAGEYVTEGHFALKAKKSRLSIGPSAREADPFEGRREITEAEVKKALPNPKSLVPVSKEEFLYHEGTGEVLAIADFPIALKEKEGMNVVRMVATDGSVSYIDQKTYMVVKDVYPDAEFRLDKKEPETSTIGIFTPKEKEPVGAVMPIRVKEEQIKQSREGKLAPLTEEKIEEAKKREEAIETEKVPEAPEAKPDEGIGSDFEVIRNESDRITDQYGGRPKVKGKERQRLYLVEALEGKMKDGKPFEDAISEYIKGIEESDMSKLNKKIKLAAAESLKRDFPKLKEEGVKLEAEWSAEQPEKPFAEGFGGKPPESEFEKREIEGETLPDGTKRRTLGNEDGSVNLDLLLPGLETGREVSQGIASLLLPTAKSKAHLRAAEVLGSYLGPMHRAAEMARKFFRKDNDYFVRELRVHDAGIELKDNPGIQFMSDMSVGREIKNPRLKAIATKIEAEFQKRVSQLAKAGAPLDTIREHYFPGMWKDKAKAEVYMAKRPLKGSERFRKPKTYDDIMEGIEAGLEPISPNPIDLVMLKFAEMDRSIMANRALREWEARKEVRFVSVFKKPPPGFVKLKDKYGTVYGPPRVLLKEYVDMSVYNGLLDVAEKLGIKHKRKMSAGKKTLGYATRAGDIVTQFATETSVLAHEIGHQLDFKYDLWDRIVTRAEGIGKKGKVTKEASQKQRGLIQEELRKLSDLKWEGYEEVSEGFKKYVRKKVEQMAHLLEAYNHAPEKFKDVAPNVYEAFDKFVKEMPELKPLSEIRSGISLLELQNVKKIGGFPVVGHRYATPAVADIIHNYTSSSLYNSQYFGKLYKGYMHSANALNQTQLGVFSMFHGGFTSGEVQISSGANIIKDVYGVMRGNRSIGDLANTIVKFPQAMVRTSYEGSLLLREWLEPGSSKNPKVVQAARAAELAGAGFQMDYGLRTKVTEGMIRDWYSNRRIRAALKSPMALIELGAKPIMDFLVPRQKAGVFMELANRIIEMHPDVPLVELRPYFRQNWNRTDARLGQVKYDRLFINNAAKNVIQGLVRAPGWSGGTIAEIGGSIPDTVRFFKEWAETGKAPQNIPDRVAYTISLLTMTTLINGLLTRAFTGDNPKGIDFWAFRTGDVDEAGLPERYVLPTYAKDVFAYYEAPAHVLVAKTHPALSVIGEQIRGTDYYNVQIFDPDDSRLEQWRDRGWHIAKAFTPFWIRGAQKGVERSGSLYEALTEKPQKLVAPLVGIMPAPAKYTRTEAEKMMLEHGAKFKPLTKESAEQRRVRNRALRILRSGKDWSELPEAVKQGLEKMSDRQLRDIDRRSQMTALQDLFKRQSWRDAIRVWKVLDDEQRAELEDIYDKKLKAHAKDLNDEEYEEFKRLLEKAEYRQ